MWENIKITPCHRLRVDSKIFYKFIQLRNNYTIAIIQFQHKTLCSNSSYVLRPTVMDTVGIFSKIR